MPRAMLPAIRDRCPDASHLSPAEPHGTGHAAAPGDSYEAGVSYAIAPSRPPDCALTSGGTVAACRVAANSRDFPGCSRETAVSFAPTERIASAGRAPRRSTLPGWARTDRGGKL